MKYTEIDLIKSVNEALLSANEAREAAEYLQGQSGDPVECARLNMVKERCQLILNLLGDGKMTDFIETLDADCHKVMVSRQMDELKESLNPKSPTYIGFWNVEV